MCWKCHDISTCFVNNHHIDPMCTDYDQLGTNHSSDYCDYTKSIESNDRTESNHSDSSVYFSSLVLFFFFFFVDTARSILLFFSLNKSLSNKSLLSAINTNTNSASAYNELRITQSYNTVLAVLGQNAVCQPDRNLPGTPLYCDQTTTRFTVTATASSSTIFAVQVNESVQMDYDHVLFISLLALSILIEQYFQWIIRFVSLD